MSTAHSGRRFFAHAALDRKTCRSPPCQLSPTTLSADETPVPGLRIDVLDDRDRILIRGKLDAKASFTFEKPAGPFYVLIDAGPGQGVEIDDTEVK